MIAGTSINELATRIEREAHDRQDFLADSRKLSFEAQNGDCGLVLDLNGHGLKKFTPTPLCHEQIAARLQVPQKYYDRCRTEAPELLAQNVNHWLHQKAERRLVRTLPDKARAFLSDRFRPLDNADLVEAVLPAIHRAGCEIKSAQLTESRLYIQAVSTRITAEVKVGDVVQAGLILSNSEVGCGSVRIEPLVYKLSCLNGAVINDAALRKYHVGRNNSGAEFEGAEQYFRDETRKADDRAFWLKVVDVVNATLDTEGFKSIVERFRQAANSKPVENPVAAVEIVQKRFNLSDDEKGGVLKHLASGGDLTQYGLGNAITRYATDAPDYDRAIELERAGGEVLVLPAPEWELIAGKN